MTNFLYWLLLTLVSLNFLCFCLYGYDKRQAIRHRYRLPEKYLLGFNLISPVGALIGMLLFHHKTRKIVFRFSVAVGFLIHALLVYYLIQIVFL